MARETVGKISLDLLKKTPDTRDPIALERELHKEYESNINTCLGDGLKVYPGDFFINVVTKKEPRLTNVLRNYFMHRKSCPTPDYDQTLYRYDKKNDILEFLWVIPSRDTCVLLRDNALIVAPQERSLLGFVLDFDDGTLYKRAKRFNGEQLVHGGVLEKKIHVAVTE